MSPANTESPTVSAGHGTTAILHLPMTAKKPRPDGGLGVMLRRRVVAAVRARLVGPQQSRTSRASLPASRCSASCLAHRRCRWNRISLLALARKPRRVPARPASVLGLPHSCWGTGRSPAGFLACGIRRRRLGRPPLARPFCPARLRFASAGRARDRRSGRAAQHRPCGILPLSTPPHPCGGRRERLRTDRPCVMLRPSGRGPAAT